jgi:16S rRNA processing protein RimM
VETLGRYTRFYLGRSSANQGSPVCEPVTVEKFRPHGRFVLIKLAGIDSPEAASLLGRSVLYVERREMPPLGPGEYYYADLLGCQVCDESGQEMGRVADVFATAAHDVIVVRTGERDWMLPVVDPYVVSMDLDIGEIRVRVPEGGL